MSDDTVEMTFIDRLNAARSMPPEHGLVYATLIHDALSEKLWAADSDIYDPEYQVLLEQRRMVENLIQQLDSEAK